MNFFELDKGDAIYVPADAPHAYLSGNIVECMARSNNVLNTGFCPRAERNQVELFTDSLTFSSHSPQDILLPSTKSAKGRKGKTQVYAPPMSEFDMLRTRLREGETETVAAIAGPSVLFVTSGRGGFKADKSQFDLKRGSVYFIGPGIELVLDARSRDELDIWRAYAE